MKNQADWLYFSGHGLHATGKLQMCDDNFSFGYQEADSDWSGCDIDRAIFATCSVLDINDWNQMADDGQSPGEYWEGLGVYRMFGYNYKAPIDPADKAVVADWLDGGATIDGWLNENKAHGGASGLNACVIYTLDTDRAYSFWKFDKDWLGRPKPETAVKRTCYRSEGWDVLH